MNIALTGMTVGFGLMVLPRFFESLLALTRLDYGWGLLITLTLASYLFGWLLFAFSCCMVADTKDRSMAWGALSLLVPVGLLALQFLPALTALPGGHFFDMLLCLPAAATVLFLRNHRQPPRGFAVLPAREARRTVK